MMKRLLSLVCMLMGVVSLSAQQLPDVKIENAQGKIVLYVLSLKVSQ